MFRGRRKIFGYSLLHESTAMENQKRQSMPFRTPMVWNRPNDESDCYFCGVQNTAGVNKQKKSTVKLGTQMFHQS